ncbi:MAG TPA: hypothetical protein VNP97_09680 [Microbacterium sp.]|nr:hypothetical protein [Microbacterium sp.]
MARTGGRNSWIAWPVGLICAAVVATLAWLAQPMVPVSIVWMGDMLRAATSPPIAAAVPQPLSTVAIAPGDIDCRTLYPDSLWAELTWTPNVLLSQDFAPPATAVTTLTDALAPSVRISCHWQTDGGRAIVSTLAGVGTDAAPIAEASLRGQGFTCGVNGDAVQCTRTTGDMVEEHTLSAGLWLSSVETAWHPDAYGSRLAAHVWG